MVSISSSSSISLRAKSFCKSVQNWDLTNFDGLCDKIKSFIEKEYDLIPKKERMGKGIVFITKHAIKELFLYIENSTSSNPNYFKVFAEEVFNKFNDKKESILLIVAIFFLSEFIEKSPEKFGEITDILEKYATFPEWSIRETAIYPILSGLKKQPDMILKKLKIWANNQDENLRRLVPESLRPKSQIKWLKNPSKNEKVLDILSILRKDPSIYVRKSVGNNLKDLSKYMPLKVLELMNSWMQLQNKETGLRVRDDLSSEKGLNQEERRLIWTMKHALRWIRERNPEYHADLEKILGKNYVLYFNEKKNRLAKKVP